MLNAAVYFFALMLSDVLNFSFGTFTCGLNLKCSMAEREAFVMGSQSGQTQGDCFQSLLSAIVAGIKRRFKPLLHDSENQAAFALHPSFKLTWLPSLVHAGIGIEGIELVRNKI